MKKAPTATAPTTAPTAPAPTNPADTEHHRNPALARALFDIWSGDPAVIIDSPPGAGKTHLLTHLAYQLRTRAGLTVAIASQTRAQAVDAANRTHALNAPVVLATDTGKTRPANLNKDINVVPSTGLNPNKAITVATTARWLWTHPQRTSHYDVLLIDEAYQLTYADLGALGSLADQYVLVGDPGQINPVVTGETRRWRNNTHAPHLPAPTALAASNPNDLTHLTLPHTWRLGPDTTRLIAPLYPALAFTSARPPRHITTAHGDTLPEYTATPITAHGGTTDPAIITTINTTARNLLTTTVNTTEGTRPLTGHDLAIITPHVTQAALAAAALADVPGVFIGTINQAQGLEREAVIAVHPLLGHQPDESFALDLGRLCVALSRHRSHLNVITDAATSTALSHALADDPDNAALATHAAILADLNVT